MFRLACAVATLAFLGLVPMATAAMVVALIGVGLASLALAQLHRKADEVKEAGERGEQIVSMSVGADRSADG